MAGALPAREEPWWASGEVMLAVSFQGFRVPYEVTASGLTVNSGATVLDSHQIPCPSITSAS
jgi:hypothetical protein